MPTAMNIVTHPLLKVQELFEKNWSKDQIGGNDDFGVTEYFQSQFDTREKISKVPLLDAKSVDRLPLHSLVRFRCMVQDTELSQEVAMFVSTTPQSDKARGTDINQELMDLRNSYYCVSIPGETEWVNSYEKKLADSSLDAVMQDLKIDSSDSRVIPERFPFAGRDHFAAVVKTHSSDVSIGVTDMVEVIGVLGIRDRISTDEAFEIHDGSSTGPRIPTVHAILMRKVEDHGHPELDLDGRPSKDDMEHYSKQAPAIRDELINYVATALKGDMLAAELVLLHYLARIHSRPSGTVLGKFSMNLKESRSENSVFGELARVTMSLLPKVHTLPLTLKDLNETFYFPRGSEQLSSGVLQVTRGTCLLMDETALEEGTLDEKGNSILLLYQVDCALTLKEEFPVHVATEPTEEQLRVFRKYISTLRLLEYQFSEEMAKEIETEFMEQRKAATASGTPLKTPNELAFDISLARLVALSQGEQVLTKASWDRAVSLSKQIKARG
ncbi:hypothetical protein BG004_003859 [Podila humilis]|nr:hypothetical protein BG004_003859 [Podila humilis]